jgi:hypothetical protein
MSKPSLQKWIIRPKDDKARKQQTSSLRALSMRRAEQEQCSVSTMYIATRHSARAVSSAGGIAAPREAAPCVKVKDVQLMHKAQKLSPGWS